MLENYVPEELEKRFGGTADDINDFWKKIEDNKPIPIIPINDVDKDEQ